MCWGLLYGPNAHYVKGIETSVYKKLLFKYMGSSMIKTAPLFALNRAAIGLCESYKLGDAA